MKGKNNKFKIIIALVVIVVLVVGGVLIYKSVKGSNTIESTLGQEIWLKAGESLKVQDGDNTLILTIDSDLNFDKSSEDYNNGYEVPYALTVNGTEYLGSHTFSNGYSVHSEDNDMPYKVKMIDFENGTIQVAINNK